MLEDSSRIEYNQEMQPLGELLEDVERAYRFIVNGATEIPLPRVEVAVWTKLSPVTPRPKRFQAFARLKPLEKERREFMPIIA